MAQATPNEQELLRTLQGWLAQTEDWINDLEQGENISSSKQTRIVSLQAKAYILTKRISKLNDSLSSRIDLSCPKPMKREQSLDQSDETLNPRKRSCISPASRIPTSIEADSITPDTSATRKADEDTLCASKPQSIIAQPSRELRASEQDNRKTQTPSHVGAKNRCSELLSTQNSSSSERKRSVDMNRAVPMSPRPTSRSISADMQNSPISEGKSPMLPHKGLEMTGISSLPWMHSRTVGCIIFDRRTGHYYNISCPRCGFNAYGKNKNFVGGISGMQAHWQRSSRCGICDFTVDDLLAATTTKQLTEKEALKLVSHPELISKSWDD